jgi:hypothetical protein
MAKKYETHLVLGINLAFKRCVIPGENEEFSF